MKKLLIFLIFFAVNNELKAQSPYTYTLDGQTVILNGIVTKYLLQNDSSFKWYGSSQSYYKPNADALKAMQSAKDSVQYIVFGGTWCEDTQYILPKFFKLQEASGTKDSHVTFFAMDRQKKTLGNIGEAFKIVNVPTIIVMRNGKEAGRIVEYGISGKWDQELADLLK